MLPEFGVCESISFLSYTLQPSPLLHTHTHAGEFQFAFLAFLLGHSLEGFSQWKAFLQLLFGCEAAALGPRAALFARFLDALLAQLVHSLAPVS